MNIGPFCISRRRKNRATGLRQFPWQTLTADDLSSEARFVVAKVARSAAKDALEELMEARQCAS